MTKSEARLLVDFSVPGYVVGAVAGLGAWGLAALAGQPLGEAFITGLALGIPICVFGALYSVLVAHKVVPVGVFAPACLFWAVGFPLSMLIHEIISAWVFTGTPGLPAEPLWQFLLYNALLSMGFAIGFLWTHEYLGRRWWPKIMDHNPYAASCVAEYVELAAALQERKDARDQTRARRKQAARTKGAQAAARRN